MKSDLLDQARAQRDAVQREHAGIVHKAASTVRASRAKLDQAQRRVQDLELSAISAEIAMRKERAQERR